MEPARNPDLARTMRLLGEKGAKASGYKLQRRRAPEMKFCNVEHSFTRPSAECHATEVSPTMKIRQLVSVTVCISNLTISQGRREHEKPINLGCGSQSFQEGFYTGRVAEEIVKALASRG